MPEVTAYGYERVNFQCRLIGTPPGSPTNGRISRRRRYSFRVLSELELVRLSYPSVHWLEKNLGKAVLSASRPVYDDFTPINETKPPNTLISMVLKKPRWNHESILHFQERILTDPQPERPRASGFLGRLFKSKCIWRRRPIRNLKVSARGRACRHRPDFCSTFRHKAAIGGIMLTSGVWKNWSIRSSRFMPTGSPSALLRGSLPWGRNTIRQKAEKPAMIQKGGCSARGIRAKENWQTWELLCLVVHN